MTFVQATFVLATFVHIRNILAVAETNFKCRFLGQSLKNANCYGDICPGNIYPDDICPYQQYLSCYGPDPQNFQTQNFSVPTVFLTNNKIGLQRHSKHTISF